MLAPELRNKFVEFFKSKGHKLVSPSSLVPENDPSVLFTSAGMQQFKGYYLKPESAPSKRVVTIQPCFRTSDIDEVGDESHLTMFEMVGNFSFGYNADGDCHPESASQRDEGSGRLDSSSPTQNDKNVCNDENNAYFKKQTIEWAWEFLTSKKWLGLDKNKFVGTYFEGTDALSEDKESAEILSNLDGLGNIEARNQEENFWGPTGTEGPCGPTVEFHYSGVEVWNLVFNEFYCANSSYQPLEYRGVDTGAGMERLLMVANKMENIYETDVFEPLFGVLRDFGIDNIRDMRLVADHIKAAVFAIADGVVPSNKDAGYVVRRLIRRSMVTIGDRSAEVVSALRDKTVEIYSENYPHLKNADFSSIDQEIQKWEPIKKKGEKVLDSWAAKAENISGKMAFDLYQSHGFPIELTKELAAERKIGIDEAGFWKEYEDHKQISRAGATAKFKGGLAGHSDIEIRYHSATHLLLASLREMLGVDVFQRGANINTERLRFDFSCDHQLLPEELAQVEALVNEKISQNLPVECEEMTQKEAQARGAVGVFKEKYGEKVKIYTIGSKEKPCSVEFCGGPHVKNTSEIGNFKIIKEESAGAGIRRIRAKLEG